MNKLPKLIKQKNIRKHFKTYLAVAGLVLAISLAGTGVGIAVNNANKEIFNQKAQFPFLYGKVNNLSFLTELKSVFGTNGVVRFSNDIPSHSRTVIISQTLFEQINRIQTPFQKASSNNLQANTISKYLVGFENTVSFDIASTTTRLHSTGQKIRVSVVESWNNKGLPVYTFALPIDLIAGTGTAATDLFNGQIKKGAALTKWYFSKSDGTALSTGADADYAWSFDQQTGELIMLNQLNINKDTLSVALQTATRTTKKLL